MNNDDYLETELKMYAPQLSSLVDRLDVLGAELIHPRIFERNVRYENAEEDLTQRGIVVRLRQDQRVRLTYKEPIMGSVSEIHTRFEAEVEVNDYDAMAVILERLGYKPYIIYEKYRTTYLLHDVDVMLDEMPYGQFIEVEGEPDQIRQVVNLMGLKYASVADTNYLGLFERVKKNLNLDFHDLTFANFDDVSVPSSAFEFPTIVP